MSIVGVEYLKSISISAFLWVKNYKYVKAKPPYFNFWTYIES